LNHYQITFPTIDLTIDRYAGSIHTAVARAIKGALVTKGQTLSLKVTNLGKHDHDWRPMEGFGTLEVQECVSGCGRQNWRKN
jgi:hypothetical protein